MEVVKLLLANYFEVVNYLRKQLNYHSTTNYIRVVLINY